MSGLYGPTGHSGSRTPRHRWWRQLGSPEEPSRAELPGVGRSWWSLARVSGVVPPRPDRQPAMHVRCPTCREVPPLRLRGPCAEPDQAATVELRSDDGLRAGVRIRPGDLDPGN